MKSSHRQFWHLFLLSFLCNPGLALPGPSSPQTTAPKPLFSDPVFDGAAEPALIRDRDSGLWRMFYTARRASTPGLDKVSWMHETAVGMAESRDSGRTWTHTGTTSIKDGTDISPITYWAPEVLYAGGRYHLFLTVVPGVFSNWRHPRGIIHLTSGDLLHWDRPQRLKLASDRVLGASIQRLGDGTWRMWYTNERADKALYFADSRDLGSWELRGKAIPDQEIEAAKVFFWKGRWWLLLDTGKGLAACVSKDALAWQRQEGLLLQEPGKGVDDGSYGAHPDVVVNGERAFLFYDVQPGRPAIPVKKESPAQRRSVIQVTELELVEGALSCDRDKAVQVDLGTGTP